MNQTSKRLPSLNFIPNVRIRVKFLEEIREVRKGNFVYYPADVELLAYHPHPPNGAPPVGKCTAWIAHTVLRNALRRFGTLSGRTFDILNKGKPPKKRYYDYEVSEVE